jgi:hypothetical protein
MEPRPPALDLEIEAVVYPMQAGGLDALNLQRGDFVGCHPRFSVQSMPEKNFRPTYAKTYEGEDGLGRFTVGDGKAHERHVALNFNGKRSYRGMWRAM